MRAGHVALRPAPRRADQWCARPPPSQRLLLVLELTLWHCLPVAGLDAFNAFNVIESLVTLARQYNRTVVFTIHQPRSNIVALFDRLVLLAKGRVVYSGEYAACQDYFDSLGHPCPPGFNIADFLIDLTQRAAGEQTSADRKASTKDIAALVGNNGPHLDAENGFSNGAGSSSASLIPSADPAAASDTESTGSGAQQRPSIVAKSKDKAARLLGMSSPSADASSVELPEKLASLIAAYDRSQVSAAVRAEIAGARAVGHGPSGGGGNEAAWDQGERGVTTGYRRASFLTQFRILSGRAFKNLYRCVAWSLPPPCRSFADAHLPIRSRSNPMLMAGHYLTAMVVALLCAALYHKIGIDLGSFQCVALSLRRRYSCRTLTLRTVPPSGTASACSSSSWRCLRSHPSPRSACLRTSGCSSCASGECDGLAAARLVDVR